MHRFEAGPLVHSVAWCGWLRPRKVGSRPEPTTPMPQSLRWNLAEGTRTVPSGWRSLWLYCCACSRLGFGRVRTGL